MVVRLDHGEQLVDEIGAAMHVADRIDALALWNGGRRRCRGTAYLEQLFEHGILSIVPNGRYNHASLAATA
jgi:hypothetical protein